MDSQRKTPLYEAHKSAGARLIDFGGWEMPVQYIGIVKEHTAVRTAAGIFDVSHMGEIIVHGARATSAVQTLVTNDIGKLQDGEALYTVMCKPDGGIVDDLIVYRRKDDDYLLIVNASNIDKDREWIREVVGDGAQVDDRSDEFALIAVQGPKAVEIVDGLCSDDLVGLGRFRHTTAELAGTSCSVARTGYTGEDGFELLCKNDDAMDLWNSIVDAGHEVGLQPIGLGARDTLRLEARLSLYSNDIDETTTPYEAGLGWVVKLGAGEFVGRDALAKQKQDGVARKLIGFVIDGRGIPRAGYSILAGDKAVGQVTSGTKGITVGKAIGLGYVPTAMSKPGTTLTIDCRGKPAAATIVKGPFYKRPNP